MTEIETDGRTVWVNGQCGAIGRFGVAGIDIHTKANDGCLDCGTHRGSPLESWLYFQQRMRELHGVVVADEYKPKWISQDSLEAPQLQNRMERLAGNETPAVGPTEASSYRPKLKQDDPVVQWLCKDGCYRCRIGPVSTLCGFPGNSVSFNGLFYLKRDIPHVCEKHELLLGGEDFPDPTIWYQTSRKFCMVARLPTGKNGNEALLEALGKDVHPHQVQWAMNMPERSAADHYLRVYAPPHLCKTLSRKAFEAFRRAGGDTCW